MTQPGTPVTFQLSAVSTDPGDTLTFGVGGGVASDGTFAPVQNGTAIVDATGKVTVTPAAGYTGPINLLVGVRDQVNRATNLDRRRQLRHPEDHPDRHQQQPADGHAGDQPAPPRASR